MSPHTGSAPRALVWDLDGTLIDSVEDIAGALNALLDVYQLPHHEVHAVRNMIGGGVQRLVEMGFGYAGREIGKSGAADLVPRFLELYSARATARTRLVDGAVEVLDTLRQKGCVHGVCTNKPHRISTQILDDLGVAGRISSVIGGDSTPHKKPDPAPVLACLADLGVGVEEAVLVGDSRIDVAAARAVGMPVIAVSDGYSNVPVWQLSPDAVIDSLIELPDALAGLGRETELPMRVCL